MSLKKQATKGFLWNALERFSGHLLSLVIGVALARILTPEDFGLLGMLVIFTSVASTFVESGMGSGLIQKQDKTDVDYSTVFVFNLGTAFFMYAVLFVVAPFISDFYDEPRLTNLLRVLSLNLLIGAFVAIQGTKLTIDLNFKALAKVNVSSNFLSGIIAVFLAWYGIGYWALAVQMLFAGIFRFFFLLYLGNWKYSVKFSKESFKDLFGFGSKLLFTSIYAQALRNVYDVYIGKYYSSSDLGFYSRSVKFTELISGTVNSVIQQVTYPLLSKMRSDPERMIDVFRRLIKMTAFINFPAMVLLSLLAEPIVLLLLTDKWAAVIPLLQWMPFARIFYPASALNLNLLNANGRSDLFLKVDLSKLPLTVFAMIITLPIGIKAMVIGHVATSFIAFFFNAFMPGRMFKYGAFRQIADMAPVILNAFLMGAAVYFALLFVDNLILKIIIGSLLGSTVYLLLAYVQKSKEFLELSTLVLKNRNG
jgi:O-antigen/teichoic acid export membrane protein